MKRMSQHAIFRRTLKYFKSLNWQILLIILVGLVGIGLYSYMPNLLEQALNQFEEWGLHHNLIVVLKPLILYLVLCILSETFALVCKCIIINYEYRVTLGIMNDARHKLDVVPLSFIEKFEISETTHQIAVGRKLLQECLSMMYSLARTAFFFALNIIMMLTLNVTLSFLVISLLPITFIIARIVVSKTQIYYTRKEESSSRIYNFVEQHASLHGFFQENGIEGKDEFQSINTGKAVIAVDTVVGLNETYINFLSNFMYLAITVVFGILAINGNLSMADFAILPAFLLYSSRFLSNTKIITTASNVIQPTESLAQVFFKIIDCPDDITADEDVSIKRIDGSIVFDHVSTEKIKDITFEIPFGR